MPKETSMPETFKIIAQSVSSWFMFPILALWQVYYIHNATLWHTYNINQLSFMTGISYYKNYTLLQTYYIH